LRKTKRAKPAILTSATGMQMISKRLPFPSTSVLLRNLLRRAAWAIPKRQQFMARKKFP
jgi:hypothetical protein